MYINIQYTYVLHLLPTSYYDEKLMALSA